MRLLDRYLLRELFAWLGLCLCGLLLLYIAFDLIGGLNHYQEAHLQVGDVVELYLVKIPDILVFILPITLLMAMLVVLTNHARHHELTAMRAAGLSLGRICAPYLAVGFLMSLFVFALNELWVPDSDARQLQIMNRRRENSAGNPAVQNNLFFHNIRDARTWAMDAYNPATAVMINPKVEWQEHGSNWQLYAKRAERIDGVWTFFGATTFTTNDLVKPESFASRLKHPASSDAVSEYLATQLSPATQALLAKYAAGPDAGLQRALVDDLNKVVRRGPLYDAKRFAGVTLTPDAASLVERNPEGTVLIELNRSLLMDAYTNELSHSSLYTVNVSKSDAINTNQMNGLLDTNMMAMPQFSETPHAFASDAKFNKRFDKLSAESAEFPILEILEYMKLHPDLPVKYQAWLKTQLQGRFATPWSCLVAVLIAIPFSAASGRRNVFVGVASAIVICFVYFILLQLGLALGTGGLLPPWLAAWLPNAVFGITGFYLMLRVR